MVALDRALLNSYRLSIITVPLSVTVWDNFNANFTGGFDPNPIPKSPFPWGTGTPVKYCYIGPHECSYLMASPSMHECDGQRDHAMVTRAA